MKNILIFLGIVAVLIIGGSILFFSTQPTNAELDYSEQLKWDVHKYLINEKNYDEDNIEEIKVTDNAKLKGKKRFEIAVVFKDDKDDKDSVYYYQYDKKSGKVEQFAVTGKKHEE
ncbi:hypothetical protein [Peribacillus simplex]|uniref:DUF3139 domain-containing protein n=1 Tax=Peribacillus simplex TaxID=1478 RepID=A0A9W4PD43_9BACI|nr:hypothetical protein [Peribacillus simplex]MDR4927255.1 hypothetical protein [Peribacillus simplex]WHX92505.1 hypothetical protein QNH50_06490 [Peribacillus simplex]CAH0190724.1 hypothetical protein SRABI133_01657 [Peribacillus simplex]